MVEEKKSNVSAIREYFSTGPSGRKVEMQELKELTVEERDELGKLCKEVLEN